MLSCPSLPAHYRLVYTSGGIPFTPLTVHPQNSGIWHHGPDDGYYFQNLVYHLYKAHHENDVLIPLLISASDWLNARLTCATDGDDISDDIRLTLSTFTDPLTPHQFQILIQLYSVLAVVRSKVNIYSDEELQTLVLLNQLPEATRFALSRSDQERRFKGALAVHKMCLEQYIDSPFSFDQLVQMANAIPALNLRVIGLCDLADMGKGYISESWIDRLFFEAERTTSHIPDSYTRIFTTIYLIEKLARSSRNEHGNELLSKLQNAMSTNEEIIDSLLSVIKALGLFNRTTEVRRTFDIIKGKISQDTSSETRCRVAVSMLKQNLNDSAYEVVNSIEDKYWQVQAYSQCIVICHEQKHEAEARKLIPKAFEVIQAIVEPLSNQAAKSVIAGGLARSQRLGDALTVTRSISSPYWRDVALRDLTIQLAKFGIIPDALSSLEQIHDVWMSREAKSYACLHLAKAGYFEPATNMLREKQDYSEAEQDESTRSNKRTLAAFLLAEFEYFEVALRIANEVPGLAQKAKSLISIAFKLAEGEREKEAEDLCRRVLTFDFQRNLDSFNVEPLALLGVLLYFLDKPEESEAAFKLAKRIALNLDVQFGRCHACASLAGNLAMIGRVDEAFGLADQDNVCRDEIISSVIRNMDLTSDFETAKQRAFSIRTDARYDKVSLLCFLAEAAIKNGIQEEANQIYFEIEREIERTVYKNNSREYLARSYAKIKRIDDADSVARKITLQIERARAQGFMAEEVFKAGNEIEGRRRFAEAQRVADQVESFGQWEFALNNWASALAAAGYITEALAIYKPHYGDDIPHLISEWHDLLEQIEPRLTIKALREASRILGWSDQGWDRIYHLIAQVVSD